MTWLFLAGFASEVLVSWQVKTLQGNHVLRTAGLVLAGWMLWGLVLPDIVLSRISIVPFAVGAAIGGGLVAWRHKEKK